ncbi:MAG: two-component system, cell cycle sensor histidine kinase and response regulator CckA, partial [Thermodesulfobacteriota bacterium]|nr:two-component system, cell cycle sensor histidine kinase and response regulator CckA [Thermodesulfobacteriota bacterium]
DVLLKKWPWRVAVAVSSFLILAMGYLYYCMEANALRKKAYEELHAIAALKDDQINVWRRERMAGLRMLTGSPFFVDAMENFIANPDDLDLKSKFGKTLKSLVYAYRYHDALLLDPNGNIVLALNQDPHLKDIEAVSVANDAMTNHRIAFGDLYICSICGRIHLDIAAPILSSDSRLVGLIVFRTDPETELYPLLQSWPVASKTAETLLVRRDGDDVVFLNDLRHRPESALKFKIPMSETDSAAVAAFRGQHHFLEARDYRGVDVLADVHPIPGASWVLIAKVDRDEILGELNYRATAVAIALVLLIIVVGTILRLLFVVRQRKIFKDLYLSEKQRSEAKEEFRTILYSIGDGVITTDREGRVRAINPVAQSLTGWTESDALGKPLEDVFQIVNEETRMVVVNPVAEVLQKGLIVGLANHTLLISRDGREFPIADSGAPIRGDDGDMVGVVLVFRDQTEERTAQKALQKSKEVAERYLDMAAEIILGLDKEGNITLLNNSGHRLLGYNPGEILGKNWFETCLPEPYRSEALQTFGELIANERVTSTVREVPVTRPDRSNRTILWHHTVMRDDENRVVGTLSSGEDITDRKKIEEDLRSAQKDWEDIFHAISHPTIILDPNHRVLNANQATLTRSGKSQAELKSLKCHDVFHASPNPPHDCPARALMQSGETKNVEMEMQAFGGHFLVACTPILDTNGDIKKIIHIATDITERKRAESEREELMSQLVQAQKMEAVGTLAGGVAHDFNNILQVVLGYTELLLIEKTFPERYRNAIQKIGESSRKGADLVRRILAFSRKTDISLRPLDLNSSIVETKSILERTIPRMIAIKLCLGDNVPSINADPTELEQILMNLSINARDAMPEGGELVIETAEVVLDEEYARTHFDCRPGRYVLLSVSDTGTGMDKETLNRIFEPFFTTKESGKGTGLGLSVVYGIVKQHGGRIGCYSEQGRGTAFKIYFPVLGSEAESPQSADNLELKGGTETILLVDDDEVIRDVGSQSLQSSGYSVLQACDGQEALELYRLNQDEISLVILDLIMPNMGGSECLKKLREINPSVKVLVASGYSANGLGKESLHQGAQGFINKPFETRRLLKEIRRVLDAADR